MRLGRSSNLRVISSVRGPSDFISIAGLFMKAIQLFQFAAAALIASTAPVHAEGQLRIVAQFGSVFLPLEVMQDQHLIERYGKQLGIEITPEWHQLSGGAAVNDALLSGRLI